MPGRPAGRPGEPGPCSLPRSWPTRRISTTVSGRGLGEGQGPSADWGQAEYEPGLACLARPEGTGSCVKRVARVQAGVNLGLAVNPANHCEGGLRIVAADDLEVVRAVAPDTVA